MANVTLDKATIDGLTPLLVGEADDTHPDWTKQPGDVVLANLHEVTMTAEEARAISVKWSNVAHFIETGQLGQIPDELLV